MHKPHLPPAELDVMACLNRLGEATAAQLREALRTYRPMAHGSMVTLLKRLQGKGMVARKKGPVGKAFVYSVRRQRQFAFRDLVRNLVQRVFHGDSAALVASLFETQPPTPAELDNIQQMLDELRKKSRPSEGKSK